MPIVCGLTEQKIDIDVAAGLKICKRPRIHTLLNLNSDSHNVHKILNNQRKILLLEENAFKSIHNGEFYVLKMQWW
jgi:hypothetical protein